MDIKDIENKSLTELNDLVNRNADIDIMDELSYHYTVEFVSRNYWSFERTVRKFFTFMKEDLGRFYKTSEVKREIFSSAVETIKNDPIKITFDYYDAEAGSDFIQHNILTINWDAVKQLQTIEVITRRFNKPYTATNLIENNFYELGEAWDIEFIHENLDYTLGYMKHCITSGDYNKDIYEILVANFDKFESFIHKLCKNKGLYPINDVYDNLNEIPEIQTFIEQL